MKASLILLCGFVFLLTGCATNPVTGKSEVQFFSEAYEVSVGTEAYPPQVQMSGGMYNLDPQLSAYVNEVGTKLAKVSDRPQLPYEFVVVNDGTLNAWALPGGKIAINRGLLLMMRNEAELAAVLAHEIVHSAARHGVKQMERGLILQIGLIGVSEAVDEDWQATSLIVGGAAIGVGMLKYSRDAETEADFYGQVYMVRSGYDPMGAVTLHELFAEEHFSEGGWLSTHPGSLKRVRDNRKALEEFAREGELGVDTYQQKLAKLRSWQPAYASYEQGLKALQEDKNPREALRLAQDAQKKLPQEALFAYLEARSHQALQNQDAGLKALDRAVQLNPDWFLFWLERGLAHEKMGKKQLAQKDLNRSMTLLPTEKAQKALKRIGVAGGPVPTNQMVWVLVPESGPTASGHAHPHSHEHLQSHRH